MVTTHINTESKVYKGYMCIYFMKIRLDITIDDKIADNFRLMFVKKKGDLSKKIEDMMIQEVKRK